MWDQYIECALFNLVPCALWVVDGQQRIQGVNDHACHLLGHSREELLGRDASMLGPAFATTPYPWVTPKGETRLIQRRAESVRDAAGEVIGSLEILEDVTGPERQRQQNLQMKEHFVRSEKFVSIGLMAAGIAHELNNPLTIVRAISELTAMALKKQPQLQDEQGYMSKQLEALDRCETILRGIQSYTRRDPHNPELCDLNLMIQKTVELGRPLFKKTVIEISSEYQANRANISCVPGDFQQIILNLLVYAKDALAQVAAPKPAIQIKTYNENHDWVMTLRYNGPATSHGRLDHIFDPFFGPEAGPGLFVTHQLVTQYGGQIYVRDNELESGTICELRFQTLS